MAVYYKLLLLFLFISEVGHAQPDTIFVSLFDKEREFSLNSLLDPSVQNKYDIWTSSNASIVFVRSPGIVGASSPGEVIILGSSSELADTQTFHVTVLTQEVPHIEIVCPATIYKNQLVIVDARLDNNYDLELDFLFESMDTSIVSFGDSDLPDNIIKGVSEGSTIISARLKSRPNIIWAVPVSVVEKCNNAFSSIELEDVKLCGQENIILKTLEGDTVTFLDDSLTFLFGEIDTIRENPLVLKWQYYVQKQKEICFGESSSFSVFFSKPPELNEVPQYDFLYSDQMDTIFFVEDYLWYENDNSKQPIYVGNTYPVGLNEGLHKFNISVYNGYCESPIKPYEFYTQDRCNGRYVTVKGRVNGFNEGENIILTLEEFTSAEIYQELTLDAPEFKLDTVARGVYILKLTKEGRTIYFPNVTDRSKAHIFNIQNCITDLNIYNSVSNEVEIHKRNCFEYRKNGIVEIKRNTNKTQIECYNYLGELIYKTISNNKTVFLPSIQEKQLIISVLFDDNHHCLDYISVY